MHGVPMERHCVVFGYPELNVGIDCASQLKSGRVARVRFPSFAARWSASLLVVVIGSQEAALPASHLH